MIDFIIVFILLLVVTQKLLASLSKKFAFFDKSLMQKLYWYHLFFFGIYYLYTLYNPSDSKQYYLVAQNAGEEWSLFFESGTKFVSFVAIPFVSMGFSYLTMMLVCSWFGYIGFVYAYLYFRENIPIDIKIFKRYNLLTVLLFLPNMHFWTVSLGKGSLIFMGLMLFTYAVKFPQKRIVTLLIGGFFVYMVRPHVMLFVLVGVMIGLLTGRGKLTTGVKILILAMSLGFLFAASNSILAVAKLENSENVVDDFEQFSEKRSVGLSESAGSGVDMSSYALPFKFFTFWFRPLFIDSPSLLGVFSSLENLIYLLLFAKILNRGFIRFIRKAPYMVKMSAIVFLLTSFAMTFVMSNLGIIMRQKSMVMYFGFFVIYYFLAQKEFNKRQQQKQRAYEMALIPNP
ncbi:hypothetical protein [Flavobacterium sangjuense]|uniref:Glycosyltransferase RgtA/B/C/D-like domain-containing protein n=1 Tax=Flavobacterium sangjuense TaxID=2518177 RepID=A0A4P7PT79_9FLAO|nr:hypothetical protein [Flavobacterium sangjuense]QBZ97876.1 hypothetical protein GS03_01374 [Flavobacterium sangjuense]